MTTQRDQILAALKQGDTLTPIDALQRFGCFRLAARINELRDEGVQINTHITKSCAEYTIEEVENA